MNKRGAGRELGHNLHNIRGSCNPQSTGKNQKQSVRLSRQSFSSFETGSDIYKAHTTVVILGAAGVGKTSIVRRMMGEDFHDKYMPTVEEMHRTTFNLKGKKIPLDIIDTSGYYSFPAMRRLNIFNGNVFILVYSVDKDQSFEEITRLRQEILEAKKSPPIVVVANKIDSGREKVIERAVGETVVECDWGLHHVETSAKMNFNVKVVLESLLKQCDELTEKRPSVRDAQKTRRITFPIHSGRNNSNKLKKARDLKCVIS